MTCNISYLSEYEPYDGGYVSFGQGGGKIIGKGIVKTGKLEFENVYFMKELKYNLFSVSQIYDNKNSVLFTDSECIVLRKDFKLKDDTNVLPRTPRQHNMYSINLNNIVPHKNLTCSVAKASVDEINGLPSKCFENNHTCVACLKRKQHKASCKTKLVNSVSKPLHTLHMDLFGPTFLSSLNHKWYCLVVTDDFSRCDNRGEFKNKEMSEFCTKKGIKREFNNARTPQQNGVAERRNRTLIEAARTIIPVIGFLRPFGCHVVILNTLDHLGKFDDKGDEGYFVGYSMSSKAFKVFNKRTKKVEENLYVDFLENKLIKKGAGPNWLFDIDTLNNSINYVPVVVAGTSSTNISGTKDVASQDVRKDVSSLRYIALLNWFHEAHMATRNGDAPDGCNTDDPESSGISNSTATSKVPSAKQVEAAVSLTVETKIPTISSPVPIVCLDISPKSSSDPRIISKGDFSQKETPSLGNALTLSHRFKDSFGEEANLSNMETSIPVSPTPTFRIHKDHPKSQIIGPVDTLVQTRHKSNEMEEQSFIAKIHQKTNPDLLQFCLFSCFLSQEEPKKIVDALKDPIARIEAIRLFLAYASFMGFIVYQMDVTSAFLYGTIDEEVYVMQPPGFQDPEFPDRVYKVEKAMYGLHQAPRAWYGTLSKYLLDNGFQRGTIDQTLFIRKHKREFLLVQVYVDDIIFGSSNLQLCREFEALMHEKFQISAMGELTFFLGLQVLQKKDGIFLLQDKYVGDVLKKFRYSDVRSANTPMDKENPWGEDGPDIDYGGATQDRKSTTGGC
uniref:Putative ribonuclease H-like domain-containing protein n=1 Tax=Tanacetum cinerariifolium TaxID=118510 RepID=A0A6L2LRH0_TANCI|nr:putative ribonuclease H-like domain-containing protein [Tanacetum cinerariifolium]